MNNKKIAEMKDNKIFLVGFMGCGKSTFGKKLAAKLNWSFIDMDDYIEEKYSKSISDIFKEEGESRFRDIESEVIKELSSRSQTIISTGGGTPCFNNNADLLNSHGLSVYISLPPVTLVERLKGEKAKRPLIANLKDDEMLSFVANKLEEREVFYKASEVVYSYNEISEDQFYKSVIDRLEV